MYSQPLFGNILLISGAKEERRERAVDHHSLEERSS
jgi:hypothetical protein